MQQQHEMQRDSGYASSCICADCRGPEPDRMCRRPAPTPSPSSGSRRARCGRPPGRGRPGTSRTAPARPAAPVVDQRRAGHARLAVDQHGAGAADLFQAVGIVGHRRGRLAVVVTGLAAMSISDEVTFMPGRCGSSNSSQYGFDSGVSWRLILDDYGFVSSPCIVLSIAAMSSYRPSANQLYRLQQRIQLRHHT